MCPWGPSGGHGGPKQLLSSLMPWAGSAATNRCCHPFIRPTGSADRLNIHCGRLVLLGMLWGNASTLW